MNIKRTISKLEKTRQDVWSFLMNNIDHENWSVLKRMHNRLSDDLEKLRDMKMKIEEMDSMHLHHKEALKMLAKLKKARKGKRFRLIKKDMRTWVEKEIKIH